MRKTPTEYQLGFFFAIVKGQHDKILRNSRGK
jgi:hypothetical protein